MRIKFIFPRRVMRPLEIRSKNHLIPSETLTALTAVTPAHHQVVIHDENIKPLTLDDSPDLVAITVYTFLAPRAYEIADAYRSRGIMVALGGLHVTGLPEEALQHADTIFIGEADQSWPEFLCDMEQGNPRRIYRQDTPTDISIIPRPRKELLDRNQYLSTASIAATRGCPYSCTYCFTNVNKEYSQYRKRPIESVVREIADMQRRGDNYIVFIDDNLMVDKSYGKALCRALIPLKTRWRCASSIELAYDPETVRLMAQAGCESVFIGLESINVGSLQESFKHQNTRRDYPQLIDEFHRNGIMINASFVFGFDHDTKDVFARTLEFAVAVKLASINFHILTPYPGTTLFRQLDAEGRILTREWDKYDTAHVVFQPSRMSPEELQEGYYWIYREFYSWSNILKRTPAALTQKPRFLAFNIGLKKMNPLWDLLIRRNLLARLFRVYHFLDRILWQVGHWTQERKADDVISLRTKENAERDRDP